LPKQASDSARRRFVIAASALTASGMLRSVDAAGAYPDHAIRLIVPFAPGGGNDFIARFIGDKMSARFGQAVIVDNKPGAGGQLGVDLGVKARGDGYTLTLISLSYVVNPSLYKLAYDPVKDITPVSQISQGPLVIVANPALPAKTLAELIALAKQEPGKINYASSGSGSIIHLASAYFADAAHITLTHVPYKGGGPAMIDTLAGRTQLFFSSIPEALPHIRDGKLRALAVTTPQRNPTLPDVPAVAETVPGYDVTLWHGIIGPKGMPSAVVDMLNRAVGDAVALPEAAKLLRDNGFEPAHGTPAEFGRKIATGLQLWGKVAKEAGVQID
jgi:tripartite-type tricarboxylate transporter receptor subunit TctC